MIKVGGRYNPYEPRDKDGKWTTGGGTVEKSVQSYKSNMFDSINNELRYDNTGKYKDVIANLDKASLHTTSDVLYRGLSSDFTSELANKYNIKDLNNIDELKSKLIGKVIKDKSFASATKDLATAAYFTHDKGTGKPAVLQIEGLKTGIDFSKHFTGAHYNIEKEFLLKRNTPLEITNVSISKNTGKLILYTKVK